MKQIRFQFCLGIAWTKRSISNILLLDSRVDYAQKPLFCTHTHTHTYTIPNLHLNIVKSIMKTILA